MTPQQQLIMTASNQNNNSNLSSAMSTTTTSTATPEYKHCACKNAKELIQLIRSEAVESIQVSWPDDMGLWYTSTIKSCEVSLQNLVEGIKLSGQLLIVDPTSARYDLSKKSKTVVVRCTNSNNNRSSSKGSINNSLSDSGDGEVAKSPPSKFSLLLDESEKSRKYIQDPFAQYFSQQQQQQQQGSFNPNGEPIPFVHITPPASLLTNNNNNGSGGGSGSVVGFNSNTFLLNNTSPPSLLLSSLSSSVDSSTPSSPSLKSSLKKTQTILPPSSALSSSSSGSSSSCTSVSSSNLASPSSTSVLGKRYFEDDDSSWLEEIKNGSTVEVVPDLTNPLLTLSGGVASSSSSMISPLNSSDSSPVLPNSEESSSSAENDILSHIDSTERAILEGQIHLPPLLRPRQYHACKIPKEDRPNKRRKNHTSLFCRHCGTTDTPEWRRGPDGRKSLCNACGLHYSKLVKKENMSVPQLSRSFDISDLLNPSD